MKSEKNEYLIPPQHEGTQKDINHTVITQDDEDAQMLFLTAKNRLLDVNHWNEYCGPLSSVFKLTDKDGNVVERQAQKGDYFKINIPAPGSETGKGYDWVYIETIENVSESRKCDLVAMRVRAAKNPQIQGENIAHFFDESATSSFIVKRDGNRVVAAVHGRNETPNKSTSKVVDNIRNTVVAISAMLGFSNMQWKSLVKGLVSA